MTLHIILSGSQKREARDVGSNPAKCKKNILYIQKFTGIYIRQACREFKFVIINDWSEFSEPYRGKDLLIFLILGSLDSCQQLKQFSKRLFEILC